MVVQRRGLLSALFPGSPSRSPVPPATTHVEHRVVPYSAAEMYAVVSNVAAYRQFLPWCLESTILRHGPEPGRMDAELVIGFHAGPFALRERYTSRVHLTPHRAVQVR
jgi:coenzyme Q-binding protein COQ10